MLFILLFGCIGSDIGGYIFGKTFKGPKLTSISPNKTISGSIGSFIFTLLIIGILMFYFTGKFNLKICHKLVNRLLACAHGFYLIFVALDLQDCLSLSKLWHEIVLL